MSWPADGEPRYVVVEVSGLLKLAVGTGANVDQSSFHVLDRAFCHRIVASFRTEYLRGFGIRARVRKKAKDHCHKLNAAREAVAA